MLAVQPGGLGRTDEKLAAVGVGASVSHAQDSGSSVPEIGKKLPLRHVTFVAKKSQIYYLYILEINFADYGNDNFSVTQKILREIKVGNES